MAYVFHFLFFLVLCIVTYPRTVQAACDESFIQNLQLSSHGVLSWEPVPNEGCTISHYLVFIKPEFLDEDEKVYITEEPSLDVSFLQACEHIRFIITPVSPDNIEGPTVLTYFDMPLPAHLNLTIVSLALSHAPGGLLLSWDVADEHKRCVKQYRFLIGDEIYGGSVSTYVRESPVFIDLLIPCKPYVFGITALYNLEEEGPVSIIRYTADAVVMSPPILRGITLGNTTVDLVWQMDTTSQNLCSVSSVIVDASPYFRVSYPVTNQASRPLFLTGLTGLQPDTLYVLNVTVINTAGSNTPVILAVQTRPNQNSIHDFELSSHAVLSWEPAPNEDCTISHYLIFVQPEDEEEKVYITEEPSLDVSFLPPCELIGFVIVPVSPDNVEGVKLRTGFKMPLPSHLNLTITSLMLSHTDEGVVLTWDVADEHKKCVGHYRFLIVDESIGGSLSTYVTSPRVLLDLLIPCNSYIFGVTALYNIAEEGPVSVIRYTAKEEIIRPPKLRSVSQGTTAVDLVWQMESLSENKCSVSSVIVDASPNFRVSYPVRDQDSRTSFLTSLTGLQPDTMYVLNVTVTGATGTTTPVLVAVQTLANN